MESLPSEIVMNVCGRLSLRDCCRLGAASRRLNGLLPDIVSSLRIEELVIQEPHFVDVSFIQRYLSSTVVRVVVIVEKPSREIPGQLERLVDYLESLFQVCDRVETLSIKTSRLFAKFLNSYRKMRPILQKLLSFVSTLRLREIHIAPSLKKLILPASIERCTVDAAFVHRFAAHVTSPPHIPDPGSFDKLASMTITMFTKRRLACLWRALPLFTALRELTVSQWSIKRSPYEDEPSPPKLPSSLNRVTLDLTLPSSALSFLADLPHVQFLSLPKLEVDVLGSHPNSQPVFDTLPSLRELHVGGNTIVDECRLFTWLLDQKTDLKPSLERIFVRFDAVDWLSTSYQTPALAESKLTRFKPGILRNLFFFIEDRNSWRIIFEFLCSLESLNELWLLFRMEDVSLRAAVEASFIDPGRVRARISRLMVAENYSYRNDLVEPTRYFNECCFMVLACFPNVGVYKLHTAALNALNSPEAMRNIALWEEIRDPFSKLFLHTKWLRGLPSDQTYSVGASLTGLQISHLGSSENIRLEILARLRQSLSNLEELEVGWLLDGNLKRPQHFEWEVLLEFKKLRLITLTVPRPDVKNLWKNFQRLKPVLLNTPTRLERVVIRWQPTVVDNPSCGSTDGFERWELFLTHFGIKEHFTQRVLTY